MVPGHCAGVTPHYGLMSLYTGEDVPTCEPGRDVSSSFSPMLRERGKQGVMKWRAISVRRVSARKRSYRLPFDCDYGFAFILQLSCNNEKMNHTLVSNASLKLKPRTRVTLVFKFPY